MNLTWKVLLDKSIQINYKLDGFKLETANAIIPLGRYTVIRVSGIDAEKFLQGQTTNDVSSLQDGNWQLTCCCNQKGRIIAIIWLIKQQQEYLGIVESTTVPLLLSELKKFAIFSKVRIEVDETLCVLGSIGDVTEKLKESALSQIIYEKISQQGFSLFVIENLPYNLREFPLASPSFWQFLNIHSGIPEVFGTTQEKFTPHQLDLPNLNAINFNKGCYRGQEIIARMHYLGKLKQTLCKIKVTSHTLLNSSSNILDMQNKLVAELVNVVSLGDDRYLGLAVINKEESDTVIMLKEGGIFEVLK